MRSVLFLVIFVVSLGACARSDDTDAAALTEIYRVLLHAAPADLPGFGVTDYPGHAEENVPKAWAMLLKAELLRERMKALPALPSRADAAAQWLMTHSDEIADGFPGWGVPAAWDAYGDGSVNPKDAKYTISTAIAVDALLDWAQDRSPDALRNVVALALRAFEPYFNEAVLSPGGLMPYSLLPQDRPYDTFNPAAYAAGVLQQLSGLVADPADAEKLRRLADRTMRALLDNRCLTPAGNWYWHYSVTEEVPNDLCHAIYIMEGVSRYKRHGGRLAAMFDYDAVIRHFFDFITPPDFLGRRKLSAYPLSVRKEFSPPRSYDVGMALNFFFHRMPDRHAGGEMLLRLISDYYAGGHVSRYPMADEKPIFVREYEAYVMLGLARFLWGRDRLVKRGHSQ